MGRRRARGPRARRNGGRRAELRQTTVALTRRRTLGNPAGRGTRAAAQREAGHPQAQGGPGARGGSGPGKGAVGRAPPAQRGDGAERRRAVERSSARGPPRAASPDRRHWSEIRRWRAHESRDSRRARGAGNALREGRPVLRRLETIVARAAALEHSSAVTGTQGAQSAEWERQRSCAEPDFC